MTSLHCEMASLPSSYESVANMMPQRQNTFTLLPALGLLLLGLFSNCSGILFFPRGASIGYLAAVAMPLDLPNRDVYMAFNFEANYGLPSNDSYNEWIDRWDLDQYYLGIGNNVTAINNRRFRRASLYTRTSFYRSVVGYLEHFEMNGTACLLRTICEVTASPVHEHNGLIGSIFKILFLPSTSAAERDDILIDAREAELAGSNEECTQYEKWCPTGPLDFISTWL